MNTLLINFMIGYVYRIISLYIFRIGLKVKLGGTYTSPEFLHTKISVKRCENSTDRKLNWNPICKPLEEV